MPLPPPGGKSSVTPVSRPSLMLSLASTSSARWLARVEDHLERHHATCVRAAGAFAPDAEVRSRLHEFAAAEAGIIDRGDPLPRMHG